jgi:hypothetical protein
MALNLRQLAEQGLAYPMRDWGVPVVLRDPDGNTYTTDSDGNTLKGQVFTDSVRLNPDNGSEVVVFDPCILIRRSILTRIPVSGETWHVRVAVDPGGAVDDYVIDPSRPIEGGRTIGYVKLYLRKAEQS